jgi:preprotein translocase subunit YajC
MFTVFLDAAGAAGTQAAADPTGGMLMMLLPLLAFGAVMYFMIMRPEKKRKAREAKMLSEIVVGDQVITKGGVVGRIVSIKDDTVTIESGADRSRIQFLRSAISTVTTVSDK